MPYLRRGTSCLCCINLSGWASPLRNGNEVYLNGSRLRLRERASEADSWEGVEFAIDMLDGRFGEEYIDI